VRRVAGKDLGVGCSMQEHKEGMVEAREPQVGGGELCS
jgi:hypothetical protein